MNLKKPLIFLSLTGIVLAGCSQEELAVEETVSKSDIAITAKENPRTINLELNTDEAVIFERAVKEAIKEPGIVNMTTPQFQFTIDEESYFLWISKESGTIMNTNDTHTIYKISSSSFKEIYEFVYKE